MDLQTTLSTSLNLIKREPTVMVTAKDRKKEFRRRVEEMQKRKLAKNMIDICQQSTTSVLYKMRKGFDVRCNLVMGSIMEAAITDRKNKNKK